MLMSVWSLTDDVALERTKRDYARNGEYFYNADEGLSYTDKMGLIRVYKKAAAPGLPSEGLMGYSASC